MDKQDKRIMYIDDLPKRGILTSWKNSIGYKVRFIYDDIEGELEIVAYQSKGQYIWIKYLGKEPFKILTSSFSKCQIGELLDKYTSEFKVEINTIFKNGNRDIIIIDREYRDDKNNKKLKWYKYKCNICGFCDDRSWMVESNLIGKKEQGCSCCVGRTVVEGINDISTTNPELVKYFQNPEHSKEFTKSSHEKIYPICPDCGRIKDKKVSIDSIYKTHSIGCSCSDGKSYNEKFMFNVLEQLNIPFETEFTSDWCKYEYKNKIRQGRYDFLFELNNKKYIVETDGRWHKSDNKMNGQTKEESKMIIRIN